jgi:hypothetical protein
MKTWRLWEASNAEQRSAIGDVPQSTSCEAEEDSGNEFLIHEEKNEL